MCPREEDPVIHGHLVGCQVGDRHRVLHGPCRSSRHRPDAATGCQSHYDRGRAVRSKRGAVPKKWGSRCGARRGDRGLQQQCEAPDRDDGDDLGDLVDLVDLVVKGLLGGTGLRGW